MLPQRYLAEELPLQLAPLTPDKIIDLSMETLRKDLNGYWLINQPNRYVKADLLILCVDDSYLQATQLQRFVYWPDYHIAGRVHEIEERLREAGIQVVSTGELYKISQGRLGDPHQSAQLSTDLIIKNSLDPLNPVHQQYLFQLTKRPPRGEGEIFRSGVVPYTWVGKKIKFLLGKNFEEQNWKSSGKWTDFGGTAEGGETYTQTAAREATEESMGFLGTYEEILQKITGVPYLSYAGSISIPFYVNYKEGQHWPELFSRVYKHITPGLKKTFLETPCAITGPEGYFEKVQIAWFFLEEVNEKKGEVIRGLYQAINKMMKRRLFPRQKSPPL